MSIDRDLVVQVGLSVAVVALFVLALAVLSGVYGDDVDVDNRSLNGTIDGSFEEDTANGTIAVVDGTFDNGIQAPVEGEIRAPLNGTSISEARFDGRIDGAIDGTLTGTVSDVQVDTDRQSLSGRFEGNASGTTALGLSDSGGLALVVLLAVFIVVMPVSGYVIKRLRPEPED